MFHRTLLIVVILMEAAARTPATQSHDTLHSTSTALNSYWIHSTACRNMLNPTSTRWVVYGAKVSGTDVSPRHTVSATLLWGFTNAHSDGLSTSHYFHFLDNSSDVIRALCDMLLPMSSKPEYFSAAPSSPWPNSISVSILLYPQLVYPPFSRSYDL